MWPSDTRPALLFQCRWLSISSATESSVAPSFRAFTKNEVPLGSRPAGLLLCARHGRYLGSERLLWAMTRRTTSERQLRECERAWGGSLEQSLDLMEKNCVRGIGSGVSRQQAVKPKRVKAGLCKRSKDQAKDSGPYSGRPVRTEDVKGESRGQQRP